MQYNCVGGEKKRSKNIHDYLDGVGNILSSVFLALSHRFVFSLWNCWLKVHNQMILFSLFSLLNARLNIISFILKSFTRKSRKIIDFFICGGFMSLLYFFPFVPSFHFTKGESSASISQAKHRNFFVHRMEKKSDRQGQKISLQNLFSHSQHQKIKLENLLIVPAQMMYVQAEWWQTSTPKAWVSSR